MSRLAVVAAVLAVVAWSTSAGVANGDPPPPPQEPKTSFGDGTYAVGTEIAPGVYQSAGPVGEGACYWKRVNDDGIVANAMTKKPQTVEIEPGDTAFTTNECQEWQKTDAPPPPKPNPGDVLGPLGGLVGLGGAAPAG